MTRRRARGCLGYKMKKKDRRGEVRFYHADLGKETLSSLSLIFLSIWNVDGQYQKTRSVYFNKYYKKASYDKDEFTTKYIKMKHHQTTECWSTLPCFYALCTAVTMTLTVIFCGESSLQCVCHVRLFHSLCHFLSCSVEVTGSQNKLVVKTKWK